MAQILALSFFPAFLPPRSGGEMRLFGLYNALSEDHSVVLLTSGHLGQEVEYLRHNARLTEIRVPKDDAFAAAWSRLATGSIKAGDLSAPSLALASAKPGLLHTLFLEQQALADVIIHDSPFLVGYDLLLGIEGKPRIYNSYNVESDMYGELHKDRSDDLIDQVVYDAERLICRHADLITACSREDGERFRTLYDYKGPIECVPNGIDAFNLPKKRDAGTGLVFIGSGHRPNRTAADAIVNVFAPAMRDVQFDIVGACYEQGQPLPNVTAHGLVDEAQKKALFESALASINPMQEGGGSSLKIADMAASGVPLISTRMGVRGFDLEPDLHYIEIDDNEPIASVRAAVENSQRLAQLAENAAEHIAQSFTWDSIGRQMSACVDRVLMSSKDASRGRQYLVLNDYDPFETIGGGGTRIRGLFEGVSETSKFILLCFCEGDSITRKEVFGGQGVVISLPKTAEHKIQDQLQATTHHVSIVDILAIEQVERNALFLALYQNLAKKVQLVLCEHPYLASLPRIFGDRFVYSSQNYETGLKQRLLLGHPQYDDLVAKVREIEEFAVGCSELVVAVSQDDAVSIGENFDLVAPVVVVPNGAEEPAVVPDPAAVFDGFNACFLGSAHLPNVEAAQYIVKQLAPSLPKIQFHIAGSVCACLTCDLPNVRLWGVLDDVAKAALLFGVQIALNPMNSGSGSNVKVADYLKNGLPVLSTSFGARGYENVGTDDVVIVPISDFSDALARFETNHTGPVANSERRERFIGQLSMAAYGREYEKFLVACLKPRPRVLLVTYRYNSPHRGGGEIYLAQLTRYLAKAGIDVDVVAPKVGQIVDRQRFSSEYPMGSEKLAIPTGIPHVRAARFATTTVPECEEGLREIWQRQPLFEAALFAEFPPTDNTIGLAWGWADSDGGGRWAMSDFGWIVADPACCELTGHAPAKRLLRIEDAAGTALHDSIVDGSFSVSCEAPKGVVRARLYEIDVKRPDDVRPLGLYFQSFKIDGREILGTAPLRPWEQATDAVEVYGAMHRAANVRRLPPCSLSKVRGPYSPQLEDFLATNVSNYDLVISHNAVFRTTSMAIEAANAAGVPSVLVPHVHYEDDYYHFQDTMNAVKNATLSLVSPQAACTFLSNLGLQNVEYHCPGIDTTEPFEYADILAFKKLYCGNDPFVLFVGRKSQAKGYRHIVNAVAELRGTTYPNLKMVMIGPDDDNLSLKSDFVHYLGLVDRSVLRGALMECALLANMSQSESFGIVILEAGIAKRPVLAHAACAAFADLIVDDLNGYLVTPETLAGRMNQILGDKDLQQRLGQSGHELALAYDWESQGAKFLAFCVELMQESRQRNG